LGKPVYYSTKTYGHERGISCAFRQWRADSHCHFIHGYALSFKLTFGAERLDDRNWVADFGGLSEVKDFLETQFDHTLCVASDDPHLGTLLELEELGLADVRVMKSVGCEATAEYVYEWVDQWIESQPSLKGRVWLHSVEVREHEGNSAIYAIE